jgi:hypothetical protein
MKKLLLITLAGLLCASSALAQNMVSKTITDGAGIYLISTNRMKVYSIETTCTNAVSFKLWDNDNTNDVPTAAVTAGWWGTNFVNGANISRSTFATNLVTSYVSTVNYTNWYTNAGLYSVTTTNVAATNALPALTSISTGGAETRVTYVDAIFTRGAIVRSTGNGTITLYYRPE